MHSQNPTFIAFERKGSDVWPYGNGEGGGVQVWVVTANFVLELK